MEYITKNALKMGNKLGVFLGDDFEKSFGIRKGEFVEITVMKNNISVSFISKMNYNIVLRKFVINKIGIKSHNKIDVKIKKILNLKRSGEVFYSDKVDMLSLIPEKTTNNYDIFVNEFMKGGEKWLRIWYAHNRGSARQLEIKRFVDARVLGKLLGQMQAEGTKSVKPAVRLEFCNKNIKEHVDFIGFLEHLGIRKSYMKACIIFNPSMKVIDEKIMEFENLTSVKIESRIKSDSKGKYGYRTYVRSRLLTEIILHILDKVRKTLTSEKLLDGYLKSLGDSFFAKLLTGDGTLDIRTKNREYNFPSVRIKITDCNIEYLKDYYKILENLGFKPKLLEKHISVRAIVNFEKLLYLYEIEAFKNTNNWKKLLVLIDLFLKGRRLYTNLRFISLYRQDNFTSLDLARMYYLPIRTINDWLYNKEKEGLVKRVSKSPIKWTLTEKSIQLAYMLIQWKNEFEKLKGKNNNIDSYQLLESLKIKHYLNKSAEESAYSGPN